MTFRSPDWEHDPGSAEAVAQGCRCAVMDNHYGRGRGGDGAKYGWYVSGDCPVHSDHELETPGK